MKTKQEQIKSMVEDIKRCFEKNSTLDFEQLAERLVREICTKKDIEIKQTKIDVLNKVKERAVGLTAIETYHICNLIDELIKEVENEN